MAVIWSESARSELRAIAREEAIRILHALTRYQNSGEGDIKALTGDWKGYLRLRVGDYRVIFLLTDDNIQIARVSHRSSAY